MSVEQLLCINIRLLPELRNKLPILSVSIQDVIGLAIASLAMIIVRIIIAQIPARHILDVLGMDRVPQTPVAKCVRISHRIVIKSTTA